jgi:hypothetical protein
MTIDEAKRVAVIISSADGGCPVCVRHLAVGCHQAWPQFDWPAMVFPDEFDADERESLAQEIKRELGGR